MTQKRAAVVLSAFLQLGLTLWARAADTDTARAEWVVYNSSSIRFEHPKGWGVMYKPLPHPGDCFWFILPPGGDKDSLPGSIAINKYPAGKENRPLAKIFAGIGWEPTYTLQGSTTTIRPKGGECLVYEVEDHGLNCGYSGIDVNNPPTEPPVCMTARRFATCYDKRGRYYYIDSDLSRYQWPGKPGNEAKEHRRIFQHLLDTLQFK